MWKEACLFLAIVEMVFGASLVHCPEGSTCQLPLGHIQATSFDFLNKLTTKQYRAVISLTMSNASIDKVNPKLKYLKNLQFLDLSHNNIQVTSIPSLPNLKTLKLNGNSLKNINLSALPSNLEELDISHNLLAQIPKDWKSLKALKILHLYKNPIDCDCYNYNVLNYERLLKDGVNVPETVTCHLPKKYDGKNIGAVICSMEDIMLYDEPAEGSGASDIFEENVGLSDISQLNEEERAEDNTLIEDENQFPPDENEFVPVGQTTAAPDVLIGDEGSGDDEGSGFGIPLCIINCSSPQPVGINDEKDASPLPNLKDQLGIVGDDIYYGIKGGEPETTTTTSTTTTISNTVEVIEPEIQKEVEPEVFRASDKSNLQTLSNDTKTGELEKASAGQNPSAIYIVVGIGLLMAVVFIVCFVKKRKRRMLKKNRREIPTGYGEEMKPIGKNGSQAGKNIPEHIPLINGQNGKAKDNTPVLKTFTPLAHPETIDKENEQLLGEPHVETYEEPHEETPENEVEVREKPTQELLTPQRERVTIRASEIPDSIPKTPVLVHRQKNSDGEIVTTVVPP